MSSFDISLSDLVLLADFADFVDAEGALSNELTRAVRAGVDKGTFEKGSTIGARAVVLISSSEVNRDVGDRVNDDDDRRELLFRRRLTFFGDEEASGTVVVCKTFIAIGEDGEFDADPTSTFAFAGRAFAFEWEFGCEWD